MSLLRGSRGPWLAFGTGLALVACGLLAWQAHAGMALDDMDFAWQAVPLDDTGAAFAWQVRRMVTATCLLRGRRGT